MRRLARYLNLPLPSSKNVTIADVIQEQLGRLAAAGDEWKKQSVLARSRYPRYAHFQEGLAWGSDGNTLHADRAVAVGATDDRAGDLRVDNLDASRRASPCREKDGAGEISQYTVFPVMFVPFTRDED